ncbi:hypothetical protein DFQ01_12255 [Paenibacillus cellulosilyticus]|uniref:Uncharacterized protein n=1 Tax=Paenibacillus cellulosilyticus TaxID=375489 RepID=A0A2V2YPP6_9BACL|nr:hypothetical protein DFQ01_12255 [Paenibacillus cellulosilyticus]
MVRFILNIIISLAILVFSIIRLSDGNNIFYVTLGLSIVSLGANVFMMIRKTKQ